MNTSSSVAVVAGVLAISSNPVLGSVLLSFEGTVDESGASVGNVPAPLGSTFTLEIEIDDSMAATGMYAINSIGYTLTVGTYTTVTDWTGIVELVATQADASITLVSDPPFVNPDERFLLNLAGFGTSSFDDPASWGGLSLITGDILVNGLGGAASVDHLSGLAPYTGTLVLTVIAAETLYSVDRDSDLLRVVDPLTAATVSSVPITLVGETVTGGQGLATRPGTTELWGLLKLFGQGRRELAVINPVTGVATSIGDTDPLLAGHRFAGIAFNGDGSTLYAVSGDGSSPDPESLFTLSQIDGSPTFVCALGNGNDGETIGWNPDDNALYHASGHIGDGLVIFETVSSASSLVGIVTYTDEATFLAAAGTVTLESFEGNLATNAFSGDVILTTDITITAIAPTISPALGIWDMPAFGGFATDGLNWLGYQSSADETIELAFNQPLNSFGINITDWGDFGTGTLTFSNDIGNSFQVDVTPNLDGDQQFFGVINADMDFTTVSFTQTILGEFYGLDEIYYGLRSCAVTDIPITVPLTDEEVQAITYWNSQGVFLWKQGHLASGGPLFRVTAAGTPTLIGDMDHTAKGLAFLVDENVSCPWDCGDGDGTIGIVDFLALLAQWSDVGTSCDFDGEGVGIVDFLKLLGNWGNCP